jgi:hypothetical protein
LMNLVTTIEGCFSILIFTGHAFYLLSIHNPPRWTHIHSFIYSLIYSTSILLHMQHWTRPTIYYNITIHVHSLRNCDIHKVKST